MRLVVCTAEGGNPFDGVFWSSYLEADAPPPEQIILLETKDDQRGRVRTALEAALLFRPIELVRLGSSQVFHRPLHEEDRRRGLHQAPSTLFPTEAILELRTLNSNRGREVLRSLDPDFLISVGAPEIFDANVLDIPRRGALNVHNGRLPDYRGRFGTFWEMYAGEAEGWVTIHEMTAEVDSGAVLAEKSVDLEGSLFKALMTKKQLGGRLLARLLSQELGGPTGVREQSDSNASYYGWPSLLEMASLRWAWSANSWLKKERDR